MRKPLWIVATTLLMTGPVGCGSSDGEIPDKFKVEKKYVPLSEREVKVTQTPEELAEIRKKSGFKSKEELAAENAKMFEKGAREYVKTRLDAYRGFVADLRSKLEEVEKESAKWAKAKDPDKAYERWAKKAAKKQKEFDKAFMDMTGNMSEGGDTTAKLGKAYRGWERLYGSLGGKVAENERFPPVVKEIRDNLVPVDALLDDIEKDDTLVVNKFAEGGEEASK
jgi:hypothetical protein